MTDYTMKYIGGHIEVYDLKEEFMFSADNEREALDDIELLLA